VTYHILNTKKLLYLIVSMLC